jgi:hypothetical protein
VTVNLEQMFTVGALDEGADGLYVFVRDGNVELNTLSGTLFLSGGEAGYAGRTGEVIRPTTLPLFLEFDQTPLPNSSNPLLITVLNENKLRMAEICK